MQINWRGFILITGRGYKMLKCNNVYITAACVLFQIKLRSLYEQAPLPPPPATPLPWEVFTESFSVLSLKLKWV